MRKYAMGTEGNGFRGRGIEEGSEKRQGTVHSMGLRGRNRLIDP